MSYLIIIYLSKQLFKELYLLIKNVLLNVSIQLLKTKDNEWLLKLINEYPDLYNY